MPSAQRSGVEVVQTECSISIAVFPNPVSNSDSFTLSIESEHLGKMHLSLIDVLGRELSRTSVDYQVGLNNIEMTFPENAASGVYFLQIQANAYKSALRIAKH